MNDHPVRQARPSVPLHRVPHVSPDPANIRPWDRFAGQTPVTCATFQWKHWYQYGNALEADEQAWKHPDKIAWARAHQAHWRWRLHMTDQEERDLIDLLDANAGRFPQGFDPARHFGGEFKLGSGRRYEGPRRTANPREGGALKVQANAVANVVQVSN